MKLLEIEFQTARLPLSDARISGFTTVCTFGSPLSGAELWIFAWHQVFELGAAEAMRAANLQIDALNAAGDQTGVDTWMALALRIFYLSASSR